MFKSMLAIAGSLVLASSAFAMAEKPSACPSVVSLQGEGVTTATGMGGLYITYNSSNYGTSEQWFFVMGPVTAHSEEHALEVANKVLATMSVTPFPVYDEEGRNWQCKYPTNNQGIDALATVPEGAMTPLKMQQFIQHRR